jgi:hypothetical protein
MITAEVAALFFATTRAIAQNTANEPKAQASPKGPSSSGAVKEEKAPNSSKPQSQIEKLKKDEKADTDALLKHLLSSRIEQGPFVSCRPLSGPKQIERRMAAQSANMSQIGKVE